MSEDAAPPQPGFADSLRSSMEWCRRRPVDALLVAGIVGVIAYYFCWFHVFTNGLHTAARWTRMSWNSENDLEHGGLIFPGALLIAWYHRAALAAAPKSSSPLGLAIAIFGALLFVFSVRTLQPRLAILSLPPMLYGGVRWVWGRETARVILFPCAFLVFMVPIGFLVSRTVGLQTMTAGVAARLSSLIGIPVDADGATLRALDGSFQFEVAGGCSGIRSLTAMTMLAAVFVHFTLREPWKKVPSSAPRSSLRCSAISSASSPSCSSRISSIRRSQPALYHDYSGFIFFPFAVSGMVAFARLLDRDWSPAPAGDLEIGLKAPTATPAKSGSPVSYDY